LRYKSLLADTVQAIAMQPSETSTRLEISKSLFSLAWPIIGLNVLQVLALAVDTAMVGHSEDAQVALTGMGYASQLLFLLMVAMFGLTIGTVAFVSRAHGAKQKARVSHIFQQSVQLTALLAVLVAVIGNLLAKPLLVLLGASSSTLGPALDYLRPLLCGTIFGYLNILFAAALRGVGNTRLAFTVALGLNGLNVVLNYGLILGNFGLPALGCLGAAIGTLISQGCAVIFIAVLLHRNVVPSLPLSYRPQALDKPLASQLIRVGWPAAADVLVLNAALLSIVGMLGRLDQTAVAAHSIGLRIQALAFVPGMSVGQAIGAMVGRALGAKDLRGAKRVLRSGLWLCIVLMTTIGAVMVAFAHPIIAIFGVDPDSSLGQHSVDWLRLLGISMPAIGLYVAITGLFGGAGATKIGLRINTAVTFVVQIPSSYMFAFSAGLGAFGVWVAVPLAFSIKALWAVREYRRGLWADIGPGGQT